MTLYCDFCGRRWFAHWPEFWPYRYKDEIYCSENCRICSATLIKLGKGEKKLMARIKKDGTPAKKPGPKAKKSGMDNTTTVTVEEMLKARAEAEPTAVKLTGPVRIETPEEHHVDIVETPEAPKVVNKPGRPATCDGFTVRAIEGEYGRYFRDQIGEKDYIDYTSIGGEEISMTVDNWIKFVAELDRAFSALGVKL